MIFILSSNLALAGALALSTVLNTGTVNSSNMTNTVGLLGNEPLINSSQLHDYRFENQKLSLSEIVTGSALVVANESLETSRIEVAEKVGTLKSKIMYAKDSVHIRKEPNTSSKIVDTVKMNTKIIVIGDKVGDWYQVEVGKNSGYIREDLLSKKRIKRVEATNNKKALVKGNVCDEEYTGSKVTLSDSDREILERLVMGEAGGQGFKGAALVAQCIRDTILYKGIHTVEEVRVQCKYTGSLKREPNEDVKKACRYIFDEGGVAVNHKIYYFYAPDLCKSPWHETQELIVEYGGHRYFCSRQNNKEERQ